MIKYENSKVPVEEIETGIKVQILIGQQAVFFHTHTDERIIKTKKIMMCNDRGFSSSYPENCSLFSYRRSFQTLN